MKFCEGNFDEFNKLTDKKDNTLYFIKDKNMIYAGNVLHSNVEYVDSLPEKGKPNILYVYLNDLYIWKQYDDSYKWKNIFKLEETVTNDLVTGEAIKKYIKNTKAHAPMKINSKNVMSKNKTTQEILDNILSRLR